MDELGIGHVISAFSAVAFDIGVNDDDIVDRLNYWVMYGTLLFFGISAAAKQHVGEPIFCWLPREYNEKQHRRYVNHYCWVHKMYYVPDDTPIPVLERDRYFHDIGFYRWSTIFFIYMAFTFRVPKFAWRELKNFSGINVSSIITGMTLETANMEQDKRDQQLGHVAVFLDRWIFVCYGKRSGRYLVIIYLFIKFLYLLNIVVQFFCISAFLNLNYWTFGYDILRTFTETGEWVDEVNFPRMSLCDFKIHHLANVNTFTVQCVLSVNIFLEKMFLVLWFCLVFMLAANTFSLVKWSFQLLSERRITEFMTKYTGMIFPDTSENNVSEKDLKHLVRRYLKADGVFVVKMVESNTTDMLTLDLIRQIWLYYSKNRTVEPGVADRNSLNENGGVGYKFETDI
uniref:Innexin n=1 Tax=Lymnaea stagnalis TaxID=6523 RepID=A0A6C0X6W2_LYMST|nr:innexin 7 [Lymnaea stagnalis]